MLVAVRWFCSLMVLVALSGCFKTKQVVALNPDGSGKLFYQLSHGDRARSVQFTLGGDEQEKPSPEEMAKKEVESILKGSSGIDAWENVSYEVSEAGDFTFKGTAYFPDFNKLKSGGKLKTDNRAVFSKTATGVEILWGEGVDEKGEDASSKVMSDQAAIDLAVTQAKSELKSSLPMLTGILTGMRNEVYYMLPGSIDSFTNFTKVKDNVVKVVVDGQDILRLMRDFTQDEEAIREAVVQGVNPLKDGPLDTFKNKHLFGDEGPVVASTSGDLKPIFDYPTKSAAALAAFPAMCDELGITVPKKLVLPDRIDGAVSGTIHGERFELQDAYVQSDVLHLRTGDEFFADQELVIFLFLKDGEELGGKTYEVTSGSAFGSPHVHMKYKLPDQNIPKSEMFMKGYAMKLSFGSRDGAVIPGEINLVLPDENESKVAGKFVAEIK